VMWSPFNLITRGLSEIIHSYFKMSLKSLSLSSLSLTTLETEIDPGYFLLTMEGICKRAGKRLDQDKLRLYRRMETWELDKIIADLPSLWKEKNLPGNGRDMGAGHPIKQPHASPTGDDMTEMVPSGNSRGRASN
jgi:hypothetical protein